MTPTSSPTSTPSLTSLSQPIQLGVIGYGEVGKIFAQGLRPFVSAVACWDAHLQKGQEGQEGNPQQAAMQAHAKAAGVLPCDSMQALCQHSDLIISAVTASNTLAVAQQAAPFLKPGTLFLDLNSASPGTKKSCAALVDAAQSRYVEAGVMTSVPPYGVRVPMLLGGGYAADLSALLNQWGCDTKAVSDQLGVASAIKMCRSVMIKGLEALVIESYTTARAYGVEDYVLPTLVETFPSINWQEQGSYFFSRVMQHGQRRAEEMRESARTVQEMGLNGTMASAIAEVQQWMADQKGRGVFDGAPKNGDWQRVADRLLHSGIQLGHVTHS
jgi:3-hydroxyisobutyrate dehydrogenase-like beta-hydroxyacid dehydrogenase